MRLYDCFSNLTASLIYIVAQLFQETFIVKPKKSRACDNERFLVGKVFKGDGAKYDNFVSVLSALHEACMDELAPESCVPLAIMREVG